MTCSIAPHPVTTSDRVAAALARLGDTADAVAATLTAAGITGRQCNNKICPVARYLRSECLILDSDRVVVESSFVALDDANLNIPRAVSDFIGLFDGGYFPGLIEPSTGPVAVIKAH